MTPAPTWLSRSRNLGLRALHILLSALRLRRQIHIHLTGPDIEGMRHLVGQMRGQGKDVWVADFPTAAHDTLGLFHRVIVSWHPDDGAQAREVVHALRGLRRFLVVSVIADPRDLVCSEDPAVASQYSDGFDYRLLLGPGGLRSLTEPGVVERFRFLDNWERHCGATHLIVRREELEDNTRSVIGAIIRRVWGSQASRVRLELEAASERADSLPVQPRFSQSAPSRRRVAMQTGLSPALESLASQYGYPDAGKTITTAARRKRSAETVIAFHTPDAVYRAEAQRLRSSLDALGLAHQFYEVTPEKNWVRTTLLKPSWIIPVREELSGPLLYIDVDAFVHADPWPYLAQYDGDMAAVVYQNGQLNSATLWINDTSGAREILARWKELADARRGADQGDLEATGDNGDQGVLKKVVLNDERSAQPQFRFQRLPVNLAYIFDRTDTYCVGPVLIEQLQASRESLGHDKRLARRRKRLLELQGD